MGAHPSGISGWRFSSRSPASRGCGEGDGARGEQLLRRAVTPEHSDGVDAVLPRTFDVVSAITHHHDGVRLTAGLQVFEGVRDDGRLVIPGASQIRSPNEGEVLPQAEVFDNS